MEDRGGGGGVRRKQCRAVLRGRGGLSTEQEQYRRAVQRHVAVQVQSGSSRPCSQKRMQRSRDRRISRENRGNAAKNGDTAAKNSGIRGAKRHLALLEHLELVELGLDVGAEKK